MFTQLKKILYTTDLSKTSAYVFGPAVHAAENNDAQIIILHVMERIPSADDWLLKDSPLGKGLRREYESEKHNAEAIIKKRLGEFCRQALKDKPALLKRVAIEVIDGSPAATILKKVDELKPDLLVMGTHGKGFLEDTLLGSVAIKVLSRIKIPLLIIPIPKETDISFSDM